MVLLPVSVVPGLTAWEVPDLTAHVVPGLAASALPGQAGPNCLATNAWICGTYLQRRSDTIAAALQEHVLLTVVSVALGLVVAFPLALLARRARGWDIGVTTVTTVIYTIPSLALFALLLPFTGLSRTTVIVGLVLYSLVILVRGITDGLDAVPAAVRDSARGMGFSPSRQLVAVELPLAIPSIMAALRVALVSTIAIATIGSLVGYGGLGNLISQGLTTLFKAQILTASVLCVLLAVVGDLLLLGLGRLLVPWRRTAR